MGTACSTYGRGRCAYTVLVGKPAGKDHWEDLSVDGRIISKLIKTSDGGVNWIDPAQDRET